jgi:mRNA interferase MazF
MTVKRGEIYWVEFDAVRGSGQGGLRPAVIVQHDIGNDNSPTTVVVAMTRTIPPRPFPFTVVLDPSESGLAERSAVNCTQLATIHQQGGESRLRPPRGEADVRPIGRVNAAKMAQIDFALRYNLGLR